jgi:hypothetical protein
MTKADKSPATPHGPEVIFDASGQAEGIYDIELAGLEDRKGIDSLDCHLVVYPYSRRVNSHQLRLMPYEEYVADIVGRQRSVYIKVEERGKYVFGAVLALALVAVFAEFRPVELLSLESIVSVFGAYMVGKEIWDDIERGLQHMSGRWRLRYVENYYPYQLAGRTTLARYSEMAKEQRYGRRSLLPDRIDFIQQSNSQTVRLRFESGSLRTLAGQTAHIASLHVDRAAAAVFRRAGHLFGAKLSLNRRRLGAERSLELFQSLDRGRPGCLDDRGRWHDGAVFWRRTWRLGKVKFFASHGLSPGRLMVQERSSIKGKSNRHVPKASR